MIAIIDYEMGNLRSVQKAFERIGEETRITRDTAIINHAERIVLPGVGHFEQGMANLKKFGLIEVLNKNVIEQKKPFLGICLGMQLLTNSSEEGNAEGLGWIDGETVKFEIDRLGGMKVPHMGWNTAVSSDLIIEGFPENESFYFVHSYLVRCEKIEYVLYNSEYGYQFVSGLVKENIIGVQFHPEKSHQVGLDLIEAFCKL